MPNKAQPHEVIWHLFKCAILKTFFQNRYCNFKFLFFYYYSQKGMRVGVENEFMFSLKSKKLNSYKSTTINYQISLYVKVVQKDQEVSPLLACRRQNPARDVPISQGLEVIKANGRYRCVTGIWKRERWVWLWLVGLGLPWGWELGGTILYFLILL